MKIAYIGGYKGTGHKAEKLSKMLNIDIKPVILDYDIFDDKKYKEIENEVKDSDVIIGSSTGSYLARSICEKHNIALISLNPVICIRDTFKKLGVTPPKIKKPKFSLLDEIIFLNKDDEIINYEQTLNKFSNQCVVFEKGGHQFSNVEMLKDYILDFIKFLYIA